jgi:hypothetical protein
MLRTNVELRIDGQRFTWTAPNRQRARLRSVRPDGLLPCDFQVPLSRDFGYNTGCSAECYAGSYVALRIYRHEIV